MPPEPAGFAASTEATMKRILVLTTLIATAILGVVLAGAIWKGSRLTSAGFLESGRQYFKQQKYPEAAVQFLNAIQKDPRNRDARYYLGLSYIQQRNLGAAAQQFVALLEYYPDDTQANLALGKLYLTGGQSDREFFHKAGQIAEKVLAGQPDNVEALILLGNAAAGMEDYRSSEEVFGKVTALDARNVEALLSIGTIRRLEKDNAAAEQALLKAREINPKERAVLISLATYYASTGDAARAGAFYTEALKLYPADPEVYNQALRFYFAAKRFDEVERILRTAQDKGPKDTPDPSLVLADVYRLEGRPADARKLLVELKQRFAGNVTVQAKLAENLIQDQPEQARREIDEIIKNEPQNPLGAILRGEWQVARGQFDAAEATFSGNPAIGSDYPHPHYFLGNLAQRKNQLDVAQGHYQKALQLNNGYLPARTALAETFLKKGLTADAREEIRKVLAAEPQFPQARLVKAAIDIANKDFSQAERDLTELQRQQSDNAVVYRQFAALYLAQGRKADAEKSLLRAFELQPGSEDILRALVDLYVDIKQPERAIQTINSVPDAEKQASHYELLGTVYFRTGRLPDAEAAYKKALQKDPARGTSEIYLTAQYLESGRLDEALQQLDILLRKDPTNASAYATKALVYQTQGKMKEAKENYNQALKSDPEYDAAANNLAYILAEEGNDLNTALSLAQIARRKQPNSPNTADTLGWVHYKLGNLLLARAQLQFAVSQEPDNAVYQYHLGMIYSANKQVGEAQIALKKALSTSANFPDKAQAESALKAISMRR
jgi:tetratricopeptide (TPR) repeat protein